MLKKLIKSNFVCGNCEIYMLWGHVGGGDTLVVPKTLSAAFL